MISTNRLLQLFLIVTVTALWMSHAHALRPDGLDCETDPAIPANRCASWKEKNSEGKWWCHWNQRTGAIDSIYGHRGARVSPGLSLHMITRESARSNSAHRTLLEAYGRQHIRHHEDIFGFKPLGYELSLSDFHRRPAGAKRVQQPDGTVQIQPIPAVTTLHFRQVLKKRRIEGATIELQVDDEDRLVSFFSSFIPDPPPNPPQHSISKEAAIANALSHVAPSASPSPGDSTGAELTYSQISMTIIPTFQVYISIDEPPVSARVVVDGRDGSILKVVTQRQHHAEPGFATGTGRVFIGNPPLEFESGVTPEGYVSNLFDVPLEHLSPAPDANGLYTLDGFFTHVRNQEQPHWRSPSLEFVLPFDYWTMKIDLNTDTYNGAKSGCISKIDDNVIGNETIVDVPDAIEPENALWESRFDEVSAYFNIDQAGEYFLTRHAHKLGRSSRADPSIEVRVNYAPFHSDPSGAFFDQRRKCDTFLSELEICDGYSPIISFSGRDCWRILSGGNDISWSPLFADQTYSADFYSWQDLARDRFVAWHEFTHAIVWDVSALEYEGIGAAFNEAVSDFFPASWLTDDGRVREWKFGVAQELDPVDPITGVEVDLVYPESIQLGKIADPSDPHDIGDIWSQYLWDLRKRAKLLKEQIGTTAFDEHIVEDLQFEALTRLPESFDAYLQANDSEIHSFSEPLQLLLDADHARTGKQLSYEIISTAARHGIKLSGAIAAAEPNRYFTTDSTLDFIVYTGSNPQFDLEIFTDPLGITESPAYLKLECRLLHGCATEPIPGVLDEAGQAVSLNHRQKRVQVPPAFLSDVMADGKAKLLFYRVKSFKEDIDTIPGDEDTGLESVQYSTIPGAGVSWQDPDLPAVLLLPDGSSPGCGTCRVVGSSNPTGHDILGFITVFAVGVTLVVRRRGTR